MIKQGAGRTEGDLYQTWLAVSIIKNWILTDESIKRSRDNWLEQEIGRQIAGIFDDILVFENQIYSFYQVKHTIKITGDLITLDNLLDSSYQVSIKKIYDSYSKIKKRYGNNQYKLIIYSNKSAGPELKNIIASNGQFLDTIKNVSDKARDKNKDLIEKFKANCSCNQEELRDFLNHLYFFLNREDFQALKNSTIMDLDNPELTTKIARLVEKSRRTNLKVAFKDVYYNYKKYPPTIPCFTSFLNYFEPYLNDNKLLNHQYPLIGRKDIIEYLHNFMKSEKKIAILTGRGGIGKSKILYEFSKEFEKKHKYWGLFYLKENIPISNKSFRKLAPEDYVIVIDDAYRRTDLSSLYAILQLHSNQYKIILSTRPEKKDDIKHSIIISGYDPNEIEDLPELKDLERIELRKLVKEVVGSEYYNLVEFLIKKATNTPLVIIVGAKLIIENSVDPNLLIRNKNFQDVVFKRYYNILIGKISDEIEQSICKEALNLTSILSPIYPENEDFLNKATNILGIRQYQFINIIEKIEETGILLRRGYALRIIPDILSDYILYNACITSQGYSKDYIQEIINNFGDKFLRNVYLNIAELDWLIKLEGKEIDLISNVWEYVEKKFEKSSHSNRLIMLKDIKEIAYYQPEKTLRLIKYAIENPSNIPEEEHGFSSINQYSHKDVLAKIPPILKVISSYTEYLRQCCDLLWFIGKDEKFPRFLPFNGNAMEILQDLAKYENSKEIKIYEIILNCIEKWLIQEDVFDYTNNPLNILDSLLIKENSSFRVEQNRIIRWFFPISYEKTKTIRDKAISILSECVKSNNPKVLIATFDSLFKALHPPEGVGYILTDEIIKQWLPEQNKTLEIIKNLSKNTENSIILIYIITSLKWISKISISNEILTKINSFIDEISISFDIKITSALWYKFYQDWEFSDFIYEQRKEMATKEIGVVIEEFLKMFKNSKEIFNFINNKLYEFQSLNIQVQPDEFLKQLGSMNFELSLEICDEILLNPSNLISKYFHSLIQGIREKNKENFLELIHSALNTKSKSLILSIVEGYNNLGWIMEGTKEDLDIIKILLSHSDFFIKKSSITLLRKFPLEMQEIAKELILNVNVNSNEDLAESLSEVLFIIIENNLQAFSNEDLRMIISKFKKIRNFNSNNYFLNNFLKYCCENIPEDVINLLIDRIKYKSSKKDIKDINFIPLDSAGFHNLLGEKISLNQNYKEILRKIRDLFLVSKEIHKSYLSILYIEISNKFSPDSIEVLEEWLNEKDYKKISYVGLILERAPSNFIFENSEFVSKLVETSYELGKQCYDKIIYSLSHSVDTGIFYGSLSSKYKDNYERANKLSKKFHEESITKNFYLKIAKDTKKKLQNLIDLGQI